MASAEVATLLHGTQHGTEEHVFTLDKLLWRFVPLSCLPEGDRTQEMAAFEAWLVNSVAMRTRHMRSTTAMRSMR